MLQPLRKRHVVSMAASIVACLILCTVLYPDASDTNDSMIIATGFQGSFGLRQHRSELSTPQTIFELGEMGRPETRQSYYLLLITIGLQ
jgi:hypothetical protein